jgi:mannitol-1-phosphate/altronate dehydrogenase
MSPNDSKPPFVSDIPPFLLEGSSDKDKWLYNNISLLIQKTEYIMKKQDEQGKEISSQSIQLQELDKKATYTNGKIAASIIQIKELEQKNREDEDFKKDVKKLVETKKTISTILENRFFYIGGGFIIVGIITVLKNPTLTEWLKAFF